MININAKKEPFIPYTIEEIHNKALKQFEEIKKRKNISYEEIYKEIIQIYDLDKSINEFFLIKLNGYYKSHKKRIDEDKITGESDRIAKYFFSYIYTLGIEKRKRIIKEYNYFKNNEIFLEEDRVFIYEEPLKELFHNFIKELFLISLTIEKEETLNYKYAEESYKKKLDQLYKKYLFAQGLDFKIPIKYGVEDLM